LSTLFSKKFKTAEKLRFKAGNIKDAECKLSDRQSKESRPTGTALGNDNISRNKNYVNVFCIVGQNLKVFKEVRYTLTARRLKTDIAKAKRS
jgi:hypothetical protein